MRGEATPGRSGRYFRVDGLWGRTGIAPISTGGMAKGIYILTTILLCPIGAANPRLASTLGSPHFISSRDCTTLHSQPHRRPIWSPRKPNVTRPSAPVTRLARQSATWPAITVCQGSAFRKSFTNSEVDHRLRHSSTAMDLSVSKWSAPITSLVLPPVHPHRPGQCAGVGPHLAARHQRAAYHSHRVQ